MKNKLQRINHFPKWFLYLFHKQNSATLGRALCALLHYFITKSVNVSFMKYSEKIILLQPTTGGYKTC